MEGSKIPLLSRAGGKNRMGKLVDQNKDRETDYHCGQKRLKWAKN